MQVDSIPPWATCLDRFEQNAVAKFRHSSRAEDEFFKA
jgi:hypothetical protein